MKTTLSIAAALVFGTSAVAAAAARAQNRPIVYAARYYNPPTSRTGSSAHLYRIEPDGSKRTRITQGDFDDRDPRWSPDGKRIVFVRVARSGGPSRLCVVPASGGAPTPLLTIPPDAVAEFAFAPGSNRLAVTYSFGSPKPRARILDIARPTAKPIPLPADTESFAWSPDGRRGLIRSERGDARILNTTTGTMTALSEKIETGIWLDNARIVAKPASRDAKAARLLIFFFGDGSVQRRVDLQPNAAVAKILAENDQEIAEIFHLQRLPNTTRAVLVGRVAGDSSSGHWPGFFRVDLATGAVTEWAEAGNIAFSPDGERFVFTLGRDLAPYGKKSVWVRGLLAGRTAAPAAKPKSIVGGLVIVEGCDWRR